jgi:hypothetical protein
MNKIRSLTVAAAALVVCLSAAREADACSCVMLPDQSERELKSEVLRQLKAVDAVFTAEAVASDMLGATLRVEKVWKGTIGDQVRMRHATREADGMIKMSSCDINFPAGQRYVVFAVAEPGGEMVAHHCSSTARLDSAGKTLRILGPPLERRDDRKGPDVKSP